jgi:hypothetical protein
MFFSNVHNNSYQYNNPDQAPDLKSDGKTLSVTPSKSRFVKVSASTLRNVHVKNLKLTIQQAKTDESLETSEVWWCCCYKESDC